MIYLLVLLASLVQAQEVSTGTVSLLDEVRISNLGKDTRDLLSGRYRQTGKPTFANGFCFADGTCQTTAPAATTVDVSSFTPVPETVFTQAGFSLCVATVTLTVSAVPLEIIVAGSMLNNSTQEDCWSVLVDGAHMVGQAGLSYSATLGMFCHGGTANVCHSASSVIPLPAVSAGERSFCLSPTTTSGTNLKFINRVTSCNSGTETTTIFGVREAH